jgi:hypothetical protein
MPFRLAAWLLLIPIIALAQEGEELASREEKPPAPEEASGGLFDRHKSLVDTQVNRAAQWVDSFFSDPNFEAESASTLLRIRPELFWRKEDDLKVRLKARLKLRLPNVNRKTSLVIGSDDTVDEFGEAVDDASEDPVVGLQFFGRQSPRWHTSLSLGVKFDEFAVFLGPRVRFASPWGDRKSVSFTQSVRYQSNQYWNTVSRLDLNFITGDRFFFRQTFDGRWRGEKSEDEGFRTRISSILTQRLNSSAGLQYDFSTFIHTRPDTQVDSYVFALRYRKRTARDWLYYEIVPQVSFDHEHDYAFNPGIRLRLEFFYGADTASAAWKREHEDSDDFRW